MYPKGAVSESMPCADPVTIMHSTGILSPPEADDNDFESPNVEINYYDESNFDSGTDFIVYSYEFVVCNTLYRRFR